MNPDQTGAFSTDDLQALITQHGGVVGVTPVGPSDQPDPDTNGATRVAIPDYMRQQKYVFKDGAHLTVQPHYDLNGNVDSFQVVDPLTGGSGTTGQNPKQPQVRLGKDGALEQQDLQADPTGNTWVTVAQTADPIAQAQNQVKLDELKEDEAERQKNEAAGFGYVNDQELATIQHQNNQDTLANQRADQQAANEAANNKLGQERLDQQAAQDAANNARLAAAQKMQADAQAATNQLEQEKLALQQAVDNHTMSLDDAKFKYQQKLDAVNNQLAQAKLALDQAAEANREADAQAQEANVRRGQDVTARGQDIQAQDAAGQRAITAGNDLLSSTDRNAQTGATMLDNRVSQATGALRDVLSLANNKNFGLGGPIPANLGSALVGGIGDWVTQLGGGEDVYKTAADLVHNANPTLAGTPAGAAWSAIVGQMLQAGQAMNASQAATFSVPTGSTTPTTPQPSQPAATAGTPGQSVDLSAPSTQPGVAVTPNGGIQVKPPFQPPTGTDTGPDSVTGLFGDQSDANSLAAV